MELPPELQAQLAPQGLQPGEGPVAQPGGPLPPSGQSFPTDQGSRDATGMQQLDAMQNSPGDLRSMIMPSALGNPTAEFFLELIALGDDFNVLESLNDEPVEVALDDVSGDADATLEELGPDELQRLAQMFSAIPDEEKGKIVAMLREALPPDMFRKAEALVRMVSGRDAQVQASTSGV
jgi:hypothetical protein